MAAGATVGRTRCPVGARRAATSVSSRFTHEWDGSSPIVSKIYGEATLLLYQRPAAAVSAGIGGLAGRLYWATDRTWVPYATLGAGLLWTTLDVQEIDRIFNFQIFYGVGVRQVKRKGPGLTFELRNHHISNAGTRGNNLGVNALTLLAGFEWTLR